MEGSSGKRNFDGSCQLLSFKVNEETHLIDLDFNAATGEYIRSMGTTGEIQIIGCIINTYLETYDCDGIKLTEEGKFCKHHMELIMTVIAE